MEALQYILGNFWHFCGFIIILSVVGGIIIGLVSALRGE